jgi:DNA-binding response OmpR family regulator
VDDGVIVVVDDDLDILAAVHDALTLDGWRVETTTGGEAGLALLARLGREVKLVLLDLMMPQMCGDEFLEALRRIPGMDETAVILFSATPTLRAISLTLGTSGFLRKPACLSSLLSEIERCTGIR